MKTKYKLKVGDNVWLKVPVNAVIKRVSQKWGYTLSIHEVCDMNYFGDEDVQKVKMKKRTPKERN